MFDIDSPVRTALAQLAAARQSLCAVDPATLGRDELLELVAALEIDVRQRAAVGFALVAEVEARGIAAELGCASTAVLLSERLRIGRREAAGRVRLAAELGLRRALSGQLSPAKFPLVAAAVADGSDLRPARGSDLPDDRRAARRCPGAEPGRWRRRWSSTPAP